MTSPQSIIIVCSANLSGSAQCPLCCGKCWYGGKIPVQWSFLEQGYVQYYPSRDAVDQDFEAVRTEWLDHGGDSNRAKMDALKEWLDKNPVKIDICCNFCGGKLGDVKHQKHDNPNFAEYRVCMTCSYQWAKEYWAWLAKVQGVTA